MGNPSVHKATSCTLLKNMKVVASYMLAVVGGNATPSVSDCKSILKAMNISLDADQEKRLEELVEEMNGKDIHEVIAEGHKKLAKIPGGGAGGAAPGGAPAGGDAGGAAKKESSSDDDDAGVAAGGLFD